MPRRGYVKNRRQYEGLRRKVMSKQRAAKITNAGKTVLIDRNTNGVLLIFHSVKDTAQTYSANFSPADDAFYVYGPHGKGIPAGKYKVVVTITGAKQTAETNTLNQRFNSLDKSPIEVEIPKPHLPAPPPRGS